MVEKYQAKSLLDYGAGKGSAYRSPFTSPTEEVFPNIQTFWGINNVACYEPAYVEFNTLPTGKFDAVVCTDVLEHCPEEDMRWIVEEIFSFATKFVYANVACRPARKTLPNGENAHSTIKPVEWWRSLLQEINKRHPQVSYYFWFEVVKPNSKNLI